jgi:hypothetical protein
VNALLVALADRPIGNRGRALFAQALLFQRLVGRWILDRRAGLFATGHCRVLRQAVSPQTANLSDQNFGIKEVDYAK